MNCGGHIFHMATCVHLARNQPLAGTGRHIQVVKLVDDWGSPGRKTTP